MTKTKLIFIGLAVALVGFLFAGSASAQGPTISVDPTNVEAAGEHTFAVTGSGWTVAATNVLPCNFPAGTDAAEIDPTVHCANFANLGIANMVAGVAITDGGFETTITLDIPEHGLFIVSGDTAQTESANAVLITVGMMEEMEEMPATGVNTSLLVIMGTGIVLAGVMVFGLSRRLRTL